MKKLLLIPALFIFSCDNDQDCFTIIQKIITNGEFVLARDFDTSSIDDEGLPNGYADVNLELSQEVYDSYNVGDEYCSV